MSFVSSFIANSISGSPETTSSFGNFDPGCSSATINFSSIALLANMDS